MQISLIVAAATNNAIGLHNQMLWHLPNDFKMFKNKTWGLPVLMGRKTFESLNSKPLPGRLNIIITNNANWSNAAVLVAHSLQQAIELAAEHQYKEVMVIGGGTIYTQAMPLAHTIYLTRVDTVIAGDTFFPALDANEWQLSFSEKHLADAKHAYDYTFETWVKR